MENIQVLYSEWQRLQPLTGEEQNLLANKFMLEFNYNSNHIEGNTLTYGQTELLLLFGKVAEEASMKDLEEMKAHNVGLKMMQVEALEKDKPLTEAFIRQLHKILLREDYTDYRKLSNETTISFLVHAGQYKTRPNSVKTATGNIFEYASPEETPALMTDLVNWYNEVEKKAELSPIELASLFHYRYIRIHPFEDGNGRIARLMVNYILLRHNYPMVVIKSKHKKKYLTALNMADAMVGSRPSSGAHASLKEITDFTNYIEKSIEAEIIENIDFIKNQTKSIWWYNGEFVKFRSDNSVQILETLTEQPSITVRELSESLSINKSAVQKLLKGFTDKGYIVRLGGKKGFWHVAIICTTPKGGTMRKGGTSMQVEKHRKV
ncbi:MAG: Fic family protein [Bacteroidales bacterium]